MNEASASFYVTGGTVRHDAPSYVERQADKDLIQGLLRGEFCYVLTSRQMGKSSLMARAVNRLSERGVHAAALDLTAIGQNLTAEQWYDGLLAGLGRTLVLEDELDDFWRSHQRLSPVQRWFDALRDVVLPRRPGSLIVFVDEIDAVRGLPFSTDEFFAAILECYNRRTAETAFQRLAFCLLGTATPSELIRDSHRTPFNIGRRIELLDFSAQEAARLAKGFRADESEAQALLQRILYWTGGHPYLTQHLCRTAADHLARAPDRSPVQLIDGLCEELFLSARAREQDDNLLFVRERILKDEGRIGLLTLYSQVISGRPVPDDPGNPLVARLHLTGVVKSAHGLLQLRNRIYQRVFDLSWVLEKLDLQRATCGPDAVENALAFVRQLRAEQAIERTAGQQRQVTVVVAQLSAGSWDSGANLWEHSLEGTSGNLAWKRFGAVITAQGGSIERRAGDTLVALFGRQFAREDEPAQAARAAFAMQAELKDLQAVSLGGRIDLRLRIALHTGPVTIGGSGCVLQGDDPQETIGVACQLVQSTRPNTIVISQGTCRQLRDQFEVQSLPPIALDGGGEPLRVYGLLRARAREFQLSLRRVEGIQTRMVGRQAELSRLQDLFLGALEDRELQIVTVIGDAGIGKSRLLYEFNTWLKTQPTRPTIFYGRASEGTAGLPYALIRDLVAFKFEIQDSDRPAVARQKLEQSLAAVFDGARTGAARPPDENARSAHFIGHLIGFDFSGSPYLRGIINDAKQIRDRALHYVTQFFLASASPGARTQGAVLLLEDIHWADNESLDLIGDLERSCPQAPLFVLCLTRPTLFERRPAWGEGASAHTRLALQPLSKRDCRQLLEDLLRKAPQVPARLRDELVTGSEGNPFYLEELVKMLIDASVIVPGPDQWTVELGRLPAMRLPPTLAGVLQARLDRLSSRERGVLQRAAVWGRVFWDSAVEQSATGTVPSQSPIQPSATLEALESLRRKELIFRREASAFAGAIEYTFRHALLRDVIYQNVLEPDRQRFHAQAASWLIEQSGERVGEFAAVVAGHFEAAGDQAEAAEWYGRAGHQARAAWAPAAAIGYYQKALRFLPTHPPDLNPALVRKQIEWSAGLGESLAAQARFAEAAEAYLAMRQAAANAGDAITQAQAWNGLAFVRERQGENRASVDCAAQAAALARQAAPSPAAETTLARALFLKGWAYYRLGDAQAVLQLGEQALDLARRLEAGNETTNSLKLIAVGHLLLGRHRQADQFFEQALDLARSLDDRRNVSAMLSNLGESARARADYSAAIARYLEAIDVAREIGNKESELLYLSNLAGARVGLGTPASLQAAESELHQVLAYEPGGLFYHSEACRFLAEARLRQNRIAEAFEAATKALALGVKTENQDHLGATWRVIGLVVAHPQWNVPSAAPGSTSPEPGYAPEACFAESLKIFTAIGAEAERARTLRAWAQYEIGRGNPAKAAAFFQQAQEIFQRLEMPLELERTPGP